MSSLKIQHLSLMLFSIFFVTLGCSNSSFDSTKTPEKFNSLKKEVNTADTSQSYILYLPTYYSKSKSWPLILLFDSHASGELAVNTFKEAAEQYGYILAGSNNAGNGVPNTDNLAGNILTDVESKFNIDNKRIYTAGFSGGARIAISYAVNTQKARGIIACSAGLSYSDPSFLPPKMDIYGIAGFEDFNYGEIVEIPVKINNHKWRYNIDIFDGGHSWPPTQFVKRAVLWHELNAMKDELIPRNKKLIQIANDSLWFSVEKALQEKRFLLAEQKCLSAINFFTSLISTEKYETKLAGIRKSPAYQNELSKEANIRYEEEKLQKAYAESFSIKDTTWWKNEINSLTTEIKNNPDLLYRQMYCRLKGFLGIISYSFVSGAISNNDLISAEKYISVYEIVEPTNPDCFFYKAILLDKKDKTDAAIIALKKAIEYGFTAKQKIKLNFSEKVQAAL